MSGKYLLMKNKRIFKYLLVTIFISCTTIDDYLLTSIGNNPAIIFDCNISKSESDTAVLIGINSVSVPAGMMRSEAIQLFLKNTNNELSIVNVNDNAESDLMQFSYVPNNKSNKLFNEYPQLSDLMVFAILLKGMALDQNELSRAKTLGSGKWINIRERNTEMVESRKIIFVILDKSEFTDRLESNIFRLRH